MSQTSYYSAVNTPLYPIDCMVVNYPVLSSCRNDLPICVPQTRDEAQHVGELYRCYVDLHNDHWSPYNQFNSDVLERRIYCAPDVEVLHFLDSESIWQLSADTAGALRSAFLQVRIRMGEMIQPLGWNKDFPWMEYDFESRLAEEGFPWILEPEGIVGDTALTCCFKSLSNLQEHVHRMQFWAICTTAITQIWAAHKMRYNTNIMWCGYIRGSPALVSAERHWRRAMNLVPEGPSEDFLSDDSPIESAIDGIDGIPMVSPIIHPDVDMTLTPPPRQLPSPPPSEDMSSTPPFDLKAWAEVTPDPQYWDRPASPDGSIIGDGELTTQQVLELAERIDHPNYGWMIENTASDKVLALMEPWSWQVQYLREFHASNYSIIPWARSLYCHQATTQFWRARVHWTVYNAWVEDGKGRHIVTAEVAYLQDQAARKYEAAEADNTWSDKTVRWATPEVSEVVQQLEGMHIDQAMNSLGITLNDDDYVPRSA